MSALVRDYRRVQPEATVDSLRWAAIFSLFLIPFHAALVWWLGQYVAPPDHPELRHWAATLRSEHAFAGAITAATAPVMYVLGGIGERRSSAGLAVLILWSANYLRFGAELSVLDISLSSAAGLSAFTLTIMCTALLLFFSPVVSIPLFLAGLASFCITLAYAGLPASVRENAILGAVIVSMLGIAGSLTTWHRFVRAALLKRELNEKNASLEFHANCDGLTGLLNRREFMARAAVELARAERHGTATSILVLDVDFFKNVNDRHGHPAGDAVLERIAGVLTEEMRASDLVGRLGGEEFIALMPQTGSEGAAAAAEKLRARIEAEAVEVGSAHVAVTASIGTSTCAPGSGVDFERFYLAADRALYRAKASGRNRVQTGDEQTRERALASA